jgi:hypothetical protein
VTTPRVVRRKFASLQSLSRRDRVLVLEAALLLLAASTTLRVVPYRWFKPWLVFGRARGADPVLARRVGRAVGIASRNLPFDPACLSRAMAAKLMLAWRGSGSSLVIGAGRDDGTMILHAWLESGGAIVTGGRGRSSVTPVVTFGHAGRS